MRYLILTLIIVFTSCSTYSPEPKRVTKSLYLNKPLSKFELDNGFCYLREKLPNGDYINYWQSDKFNIIRDALDWDSYPYCKLVLYTNSGNIVTQIKILEDDIKCAYILK